MAKELGILMSAFLRALLLSLGLVLLVFTAFSMVKFITSAMLGKAAWAFGLYAFSGVTLLTTIIFYEIEKKF